MIALLLICMLCSLFLAVGGYFAYKRGMLARFGIGSGTGIAALINGTVDIANASRQIKDKEIAVDYKITTNNQYYIDSVSTEIESTVLDSIYQLQRQNAIIKKVNPFVFDDFEQEENRLVTLFRNSGIYHFKKNSMGFYTDSVKGVYKKDVLLKIPDRIVRVNDSVFKVPYKVQNVTEVNVYTDFEIKKED